MGKNRVRGIEVMTKRGESLKLPVSTAWGETAMATIEQRIRDIVDLDKRAAHADDEALLLARGDLAMRDWIGRLKAIGVGATATLRTAAVMPEQLWRVASDAAQPPIARAAAAVALAPSLDAAGRVRLADLAKSTAAPKLRVALEHAAEDADEDTLEKALSEMEDSSRVARPVAERFDVTVAKKFVGLIHRGFQEANFAVRIVAVGRGNVRRRRGRETEVVFDDDRAVRHGSVDVGNSVDLAIHGIQILRADRPRDHVRAERRDLMITERVFDDDAMRRREKLRVPVGLGAIPLDLQERLNEPLIEPVRKRSAEEQFEAGEIFAAIEEQLVRHPGFTEISARHVRRDRHVRRAEDTALAVAAIKVARGVDDRLPAILQIRIAREPTHHHAHREQRVHETLMLPVDGVSKIVMSWVIASTSVWLSSCAMPTQSTATPI